MGKGKTENVYPGNGFWYIRYKDPVTNKWKAVSTKLKSSRRNYKLAIEYRDSLMAEIEKAVSLEYRQGDVQYAFNHFKKINASKSKSTISTYEMFYGYLIQRITPDTPCLLINKEVAEDFLLWLGQLTHIQQNTKFEIQKNFQKFLRFLFEYEYIPRIFILNKDVKVRAKTAGKLIDNVVTLEGLFTTVLFTKVRKGKDAMEYFFTTQTDGATTAKSPRGMFDTLEIPNDLNYVITKMNEYNK